MTAPLPASLSSGERYLYQLFQNIHTDGLTVINPEGQTFEFGDRAADVQLKLIIRDRRTFDRILSFGAMGFCEAYMDGWWDEGSDRIAELIGLFHRNQVYSKASQKITLPLVFRVLAQRLATVPVRIENSRKNVQHHYNLDNEFYQLFLDSTMTYSCGYQRHPADSLEQMQLQKYELIARKLALQPGDTLIDIGCGWGGMLIYAAERYGVKGTGITLSENQAALARDRIAAKGLSDQVEIVIQDYREITGQYDKFVSIGMFEHVGARNFSTFMQQAKALLKPNGLGVLHTIVTESKERIGPWVDKYIFPGGYAPQLHELSREMLATKLSLAHCDDLKLHYAETLRLWAENFTRNRAEIEALAPQYDQRFQRMWYLYLESFQASFRYGGLHVYQLLFTPKTSTWPFPMTFDFTNDFAIPEPLSTQSPTA